jgi:hypothetical protein
VETIAAGKDEATFKIQANDKAAPGVYRIAMSASTTGGDGYSGVGRIRASSAFVNLEVAEPFVTIDLDRGSVERGKTAHIAGTIHQNKPFPGEATVTLEQLPAGLKLVGKESRIRATDAAVDFEVEASPDALAGLYKDIQCAVTFTVDGQTIREHTGSGIIRVDAPRTVSASVH